jgi:Asp-tRNA(Asn)/Glu-tRNA(Gln) amidotransferase A subunit family amidase
VIDGREEPIIEAVVRTTAPFNLAGLPVVAMPMGLTDDGLPLSVQFVGRAYGDGALIALASEYERLREQKAIDDNRPIGRQRLGRPSLR